MENNTDINFKVLLQNHAPKIASNIFAIVTIIVFVPLYYFIFWYEQNVQWSKRTLLNQLNAFFCQTIIAYLMFVMSGDIIVSMASPLPAWYCHLQVFLKGLSVFVLILTIDVILLVKYAFIFWLKNPAAVIDGFWTIFLRFLIIGFTCLSQLVYFFLPGRQALHFYICIGTLPADEQLLPIKSRLHSIIITNISLIFCIIIMIRIKYFDKTASKSQNKSSHLIGKAIEGSILESKGSVVVAMLVLCIVLAFNFLNNTLNPVILNRYPNYVYYWVAYVVPKCLVSSFWLLMIFHKKDMRIAFVKVISSFIKDIQIDVIL